MKEVEIFQREIWFLSDLHFDVIYLPKDVKEGKRSPTSEEQKDFSERVQKSEDNFVDFLKQHNEKLFVFAGDFYGNYIQSGRFFLRLEAEKINCFFVLGNHDYWSNGGKTYDEVEDYIYCLTKDNIHARFLKTGLSYNVDGLTFIGDCGFTSFLYLDDASQRVEIAKQADFDNEDVCFIETKQVKDWNVENIRDRYHEWIHFANEKIKSLKKLIIVTHFPMNGGDIPSSHNVKKGTPQLSTWWGSEGSLIAGKRNYWAISGHTHKYGNFADDEFISTQLGYAFKNDKIGFNSLKFNEKWFGKLKFYSGGNGIIPSSESKVLAKYASFSTVKNPTIEIDTIKAITHFGYKRMGNYGNKLVMYEFMRSPSDFCRTVLKKAKKKPLNRIGFYDDSAYETNKARGDVIAAVEILKKGFDSNPFEFITALIVAGYAYNDSISLLQKMRPVNVYDVIRYSFILLTLEDYKDKIKLFEIDSIRRSRTYGASFIIANVEIYIPVVNGFEVSRNRLEPFVEKFTYYIEQNKDAAPLLLKGPLDDSHDEEDIDIRTYFLGWKTPEHKFKLE